MLTYIFLPGLLFLSIYLVVRWERLSEKEKSKAVIQLDEFETKIS
jgi:hypothetical protein